MIGPARSWHRAARRTVLIGATLELTATAAEAQRRPCTSRSWSIANSVGVTIRF